MRFLKAAAVMAAVMAALGSTLVAAASKFTPAKPPAVPLAVRSPYLNAWLQGDSGCNLPGYWPKFWTGSIQGWQGMVMVDGKAYNWMGDSPLPLVKQVSLEYTSTRSIFHFDVDGKVNLEVTFLSPVYPDDLGRQSQQFSYISVKALSADGASHNVQVYMDVSGEWASGDHSKVIKWASGATDAPPGAIPSQGMVFHSFFREDQQEFAEVSEIASWGNWYLATGNSSGVTWQTGQDTVVRGQFASKGSLANTQDTNFRAVSDRWPVFAFSQNLGDVKSNSRECLFTLGLVQDQVINFAGHSGTLAPVPGLWSSYYKSDINAVRAFYYDYQNALVSSSALDAKIQKDSVNAAGQDYATITTLAVRQTFGGLQYAGTASKPYIFLKEISSNSDIQTVDVIFPAFPIFLYLNPTLGRYLLDPLYENQESGAYPNAYAEHDLGTFPVAKGYPAGNDEPMPLEECGNMIIMTLAYAQRTSDLEYLDAHYTKLSQWAEFLVNDSLIPAHQLSTDDFAGPLSNQTNLAIKGIIGLMAMSKVAQMTKHEDPWNKYAVEYLERWKDFAINKEANPPHTTLSYGDKNSHGILYNIYADKLLNLNFIDQSIFDMQSAFYPTVALEYAVPLDTRHTWAKSDWAMFAAAVASTSTRDMFISKLARWVGNTSSNRAMTDLFDAQTGAFPEGGPTFVARPVQGGMFALLALPKGGGMVKSEKVGRAFMS